MEVEIYTRGDCGACQRVKSRLISMEILYTEHIVGVDCTSEFVKENFPGKAVLPIVVINDVVYAGAPAVERALNEYKQDFGKDLLNE